MTRMRRILFASDFSPASTRAFKTALAMARVNGATVTILHVSVPLAPIVPDQYLQSATWSRIDAEARRWSQRRLAALAQQAKRSGVRATSLLRDGIPAREIVLAARSKRADLIVMGTHGRSGLAKLVVGSVAARVVAAASCPVLTVRGGR